MRLFWLIAVLVCANAAPSIACSPIKSYKTPTNYELVRKATVIVLARVKDVPTMEVVGSDGTSVFERPAVTLQPIQFLKGSAAADQLRLIGWRPGKNWSGVTSTTTLAQSHWSTGIGGCIRQFYEPGELVVAMFAPSPEMKEVTGHELGQIFAPFARVVETVDGPDDVWVHAVENYVSLQSGADGAAQERITEATAELGQSKSQEAQAIAEDLQYQLTGSDSHDVWANFSTPLSTVAGIRGNSGSALYCLAGTTAGVMIKGQRPSSVEVRTVSTVLAAQPAAPSPVEKSMTESPLERLVGNTDKDKTFLFHFVDTGRAIAAMRAAEGTVEIVTDGQSRAAGRPLDALLRWAGQCEKLQKLPAPSEEDLKRGRD